MYKINKPEIVLEKKSVKSVSGQMEEYKRFSGESELVGFLARFHKPILSWDGYPIHGQFQNDYMDFQCLSGKQLEKGYRYCGIDGIYVYHTFDKIWTPCLYRFYLDVPGTPLYDVRNLEPEVRKAYYERQKQKLERKTRLQMLAEWEKWCRTKQGRKTHTCCNTRHHSYIRGMAQEIGLMYDDDEYRQLVKPKMLQYKYCWSDDFYTRRSNGWKDNPDNKYRKQWERGAVRKFKKEVKETQSK